MRAAVSPDSEDPAEVHVETVPDPAPAPGEAVVCVEACSVNQRDLWKLDGPRERASGFGGGGDVTGVVERVKPVGDIALVEPGDRVVFCPLLTCGTCRFCREGPENYCAEYDSYDGGFAEQCVVAADRLVALPERVGFVEATTLPVAYIAAWRMLERAIVTAGDRAFVPGGTGGIGVVSIQLTELRRAETIGTSASSRKLDRLAELGCDHTIQIANPDEMVDQVAEIGPVDATLNYLGGPFGRSGMAVLQRGGSKWSVVGRPARRPSDQDLWDTYWNHKGVFGSTLGTQPDLERDGTSGSWQPATSRPSSTTPTRFPTPRGPSRPWRNAISSARQSSRPRRGLRWRIRSAITRRFISGGGGRHRTYS